ncbi:MAG TPA: SAM-dependent methyltransferase, partial [Chryseobacterium sp.]|nr:SAM-dependent methyltransferase [Chryseobacterium sp.]
MAWFETWFNTPYYHILYKDRNFEEAENFIS